MASIFDRAALTAAQLRTVADRRLGDAESLLATGQNARLNGAVYLAGFVLECLLKAKLLEKHPWLGSASRRERPADEARLWSLCYRSHDLGDLLAELPEVEQWILKSNPVLAAKVLHALQSVAGQWSVVARYSPRQIDRSAASKFIAQVKEVRPWLT